MVIAGVAPDVFSVRLSVHPAPGQFKLTVSVQVGQHQVIAIAAGVVGLEVVGRPAVARRDRPALRQIGEGAGDRIADAGVAVLLMIVNCAPGVGAKFRVGVSVKPVALKPWVASGTPAAESGATMPPVPGVKVTVPPLPSRPVPVAIVEDDLARAGGVLDDMSPRRRWWPAWRS